MKTIRTFFGIIFLTAFLFTNTLFVGAQTVPMDMTPPADTTTAPDTTTSTEDTTPAVPEGPAVGSVSVTDITDTSARIDVNSDEVVQGYVEYGTTEQYGMSTPLTSEFSTSPSFILENLTPETLYHYRVIVMDAGGNATITSDETFTTLATPEEPAPPPPTATTTPTTATTTSSTPTPAPALFISNTETATVSTSTAHIIWETNKSADGQVSYGTTNAYGSLSPVGAFSLSHSVNLSALAPNTKYYYRAISKTSEGEVAYGAPQEFTTLAVAIVPTPPVISSVSVSAIGTSTATVSWTTSKPATSNIQYGKTTSYGSAIGKDTTLKTSHTRTISNLTASTLYHFRIIVTDSENNTALGKDRTFTTTAATTEPIESTPPPSTSPSTTPPPVVSPPPATESDVDLDSGVILSKIAEQELAAADAAGQGVGGLPVMHVAPHLLRLTPLDGQISFEWRKDRGAVAGSVRTIIVKKEGRSAVKSRIDGKIIYDGPATSFTDTKVENGKEYHYALYSYGAFGRFTFPAKFKVIPRGDKEQIDLSPDEAVVELPEEVGGGVAGKVSPPLSLSRNLFVGRQGEDVAMLQKVLAQSGLYPEALTTGYFGALTRAAVVRYQKLNGITPSLGFVGPLTRDALAR